VRLEEERKMEREDRERKESIKQMESRVGDAMENVKILNLRFEKVSKGKEELLKEAEEIIKGKVAGKDRKECEWILRKSRVYILGEGTVEKEVGEERICTAPLLVKCGSQAEGKVGVYAKECRGEGGLSLAERNVGVCGRGKGLGRGNGVQERGVLY